MWIYAIAGTLSLYAFGAMIIGLAFLMVKLEKKDK